MNIQQRIVYQIFPFGFCGAPKQNDGITVDRIHKVAQWIPHIKCLGANTVYFCPVFDSDSHGYDTRDFMCIDPRLGSNEHFAAVCTSLRREGIDVILDGVFNHVGRGFWAFQDVVRNREASPYQDWFYLDLNGESNYGDGLWYEGWEGHFELVKLRLETEAVQQHIFEAITYWVKTFGISGLRLDVAYLLPDWFLERLRSFCSQFGPDFHLIGEAIHGDYRRLAAPGRLDSVTNYECYKGIYSSLNERNMFEIGYSLKRQFGPEDWTVYKGLPLLSFADNHDVNRLGSTLNDLRLLPLAYGFLFTMPGFPSIYYGSEWGAEGIKGADNDDDVRRCYEVPVQNELTEWIGALAKVRQSSEPLLYGGYQEILCTNPALCFQRELEGNRVAVLINSGEETFHVPGDWRGKSLLSGETIEGAMTCPAMSVEIYQLF